MDKPTSAQSDAEIRAAARYGNDQLQKKMAARKYGDGLDRFALREGMLTFSSLALLVFATAMYVFGELVFAWQSGATFLPGLKAGDVHFGGVVSVMNSLIFILLVFQFIADGRPLFPNKEKGLKGNDWTWPMVASAGLALFAIYTAQTTAADEVRALVGKREAYEGEISRLDGDIKSAVIPARRPAELALERAQDQAVGSGLNTMTEGEARILCADVKDFEARMTCQQKILRASVNCTKSVSVKVRESACDDIKFAQMRIATIDDEEKLQAQRQADLQRNKDELAALPEASNYFVRQIADWTKWAVPDAQSRIYLLIAVICLLVPAIIFAKVFVRREDVTPAAGP